MRTIDLSCGDIDAADDGCRRQTHVAAEGDDVVPDGTVHEHVAAEGDHAPYDGPVDGDVAAAGDDSLHAVAGGHVTSSPNWTIAPRVGPPSPAASPWGRLDSPRRPGRSGRDRATTSATARAASATDGRRILITRRVVITSPPRPHGSRCLVFGAPPAGRRPAHRTAAERDARCRGISGDGPVAGAEQVPAAARAARWSRRRWRRRWPGAQARRQAGAAAARRRHAHQRRQALGRPPAPRTRRAPAAPPEHQLCPRAAHPAPAVQQMQADEEGEQARGMPRRPSHSGGCQPPEDVVRCRCARWRRQAARSTRTGCRPPS